MNNDKVCCLKCFSDPYIRDYVKESENLGECDYCECTSIYVRSVKEVGEFVFEGILKKYEGAVESVAYESAEGGYQLPTETLDEILMREDMFGEDLDDPQFLIKDLVLLDGTPYVRQDPYGPIEGGYEDIKTWNEFCTFVKYNQRYTALIKSKDYSYDKSHPSDFLDFIAKSINYYFIKELIPGEKIFRARIEEIGKIFSHKDLTSPPPKKTTNNRMSPAGISFFYGGLDIDTCIKEVRPSVGQRVAIAEFEVLNKLKVLNLAASELEEKQLSIFDEKYYFGFEEYIKPFLSYFAKDIAKPVNPNDAAIDYVPTQIFTEFVRMRKFKQPNYFESINEDLSNYKVNGILFKSRLKQGGVNVVLSKGPTISTGQHKKDNKAWLLYRGHTLQETI